MKKNINFIYKLEFLILIFVIMFNFILKNFTRYETIINILFWIMISAILFFKLHFYKDSGYLKNYSIKILIICLMSTLIILYSLGLITGYGKTVFIFKIKYILKNIIPVIILAILQEYIRYTVAKNSKDNVLAIVFLTILFITLNIITEINYHNFEGFESIFIFICSFCLPLIANEAIYSYISYQISFTPTIILRTCIDVYPYVLPFYPILNEYLTGMIGITFPFIIYYLLRRAIKYHLKGDYSVKTVKKVLIITPLTLLLLTIFIFVSGLAPYKMIAIGSNSMKDIYSRGDAVIYYQFKNKEKNVKIGEIIVFQKQDKIVTHRVIDIEDDGLKKIYTTKGDANEVKDNFNVYENEILGIVKYKIDYIGYPTIWVSEMFQGR